MAYNSYYPSGYQPYQYPQYQQQNAGQQSIIWVQGEAGAKSYLVAPNTTVLLMDSESQHFYLKSSDASGMPMPLRVFEYTEKTPNMAQNAPKAPSATDSPDYVTKREFEAFKSQIEAYMQEGKNE